MSKYLVKLKKPFKNAIWAGLGHVTGYLSTPEDEKVKTKRQAVGNRLEALTGNAPEWQQSKYQYIVEMTAEQAEEVRSWSPVRRVVEDG